MEMEVEVAEDDVFFAELSKRISLLVTDDDDDDDFGPAPYPPGAPLAGLARAHVPQAPSMPMPPAYTLYHHAASYGATNGGGGIGVRSWQCGSKGTGVFIPRSSPSPAHPRRKTKPKASNSSNAAAAAATATASAAQKPRAAGAQRRRA